MPDSGQVNTGGGKYPENIPRPVIRTVEGSVSQRFEDLKGRMDRGEGKGAGLSSAGGALLAIAGVLIAAVSVSGLHLPEPISLRRRKCQPTQQRSSRGSRSGSFRCSSR